MLDSGTYLMGLGVGYSSWLRHEIDLGSDFRDSFLLRGLVFSLPTERERPSGLEGFVSALLFDGQPQDHPSLPRDLFELDPLHGIELDPPVPVLVPPGGRVHVGVRLWMSYYFVLAGACARIEVPLPRETL